MTIKTFLLFCLITATTLRAQTSIINVDDPRPLMRMLDELEQRFGISINYEDPLYQHSDDLVDVTDKVQNPRQRAMNPNVRIMIPRGGQATLEVPVSSQLDSATIVNIITNMRLAHEARYPGKFTVHRREAGWYVEPTSVRGVSGSMAPQTPVSETSISLPEQQRNAAECLDAILQQAGKKVGVKIGIGMIPAAPFAASSVKCGANNEPLAVVLARLFSAVGGGQNGNGNMSYRLLYDATVRMYMLNLRTSVSTPAVQNVQPPPGIAVPQQSPAFVKQQQH